MKMAKRILSLVLVLAMIACLSVTAFADGTSNTATIVVKASGNAVDTMRGPARSGGVPCLFLPNGGAIYWN